MLILRRPSQKYIRQLCKHASMHGVPRIVYNECKRAPADDMIDGAKQKSVIETYAFNRITTWDVKDERVRYSKL